MAKPPKKLSVKALSLNQEEDISNASYFCREIENLMRRSRMGVMEAVIYLADEHSIEPEFAADLLNADLKQKVLAEAQNLHLLPRSASLPL